MAKHLDPEYKDYLCRLVVEENRKISELSRELNLSAGSMYKWVRAYRKKIENPTENIKVETADGAVYMTPSDYEKALKQRDKEIEKLVEQNEILKKAMHVFTKNPE